MSTTQSVRSITRQRPPRFMDFELLRAEGIKHLEELATFIWTDFNAHDPGITMLEVLCYALTDLGYRVNFPFEDLMAGESGNYQGLFFGAEESLSASPVTELDYRKLLIDVPGVRNAWLEKAPGEFPLYWEIAAAKFVRKFKAIASIEDRAKALLTQFGLFTVPFVNQISAIYSQPDLANQIEAFLKNFEIEDSDSDEVKKTKREQLKKAQRLIQTLLCEDSEYLMVKESKGDETKLIPLNGLYKITLDFQDPSIVPTEQRAKRIIERARKRLQANRNLCEDFVAFEIVEPVKVCLCIHLEIVPDADSEEVMARVLFDLQEFLTPTVKFHTLQALLEKGLPGDQIYNGPALQHGFLDDAEVAQSALRQEIFTSDLYNVILAIPEIISVKEFQLMIGDQKTYSANWQYPLGGKKPIIDPCCSNLTITQGAVTKTLKEKNIAPFLEYLQLVNLDIPTSDITELPSPQGAYRPDLADYTSVQYDFPRTYYLGDEMPPDKVGVARLAHIKQLKAYLSFFDRLLANYLQQLSRVRDMFAVQTDQNADTLFFSTLELIPGIKELIIQNPVITLQKIDYAQHAMIYLLEREQENKLLEAAFISGFKQKVEEHQALSAEFIRTLIAILPESLAKLNHQPFASTLIEETIQEWVQKVLTQLQVLKKSQFPNIETLTDNLKQLFDQILADPLTKELLHYTSHLGDLRAIVEGEDNNLERREKLLNHLIARFGEQFTDYTVELFQRSVISSTYTNFEAYLGDKSMHLANLPSLLRDRAKAYHYQRFKTDIPAQPDVWNTTNISGLQKKVYSLFGIKPETASLTCDPRYQVALVPDPSKERRSFFIRLVEQNSDGSIKQILLTSTQSYLRKTAELHLNKVRERIETDGKNELLNSNDPSFSVEMSSESTSNYQVIYTPAPVEYKDLILVSEPRIKKDTDELLTHILDLVNPDQCEKEGFHLVEHILLRPNDDRDELLSVPKTCDPAHPPVDPYSFWITVVLPAGTRRFKDKDFQQYFEQIFLAETPAHIAVCFLWIDDRVWMKRFEDAFEKWREAKAKCSPDECNVTEMAKNLIQVLKEKPCACHCFDRNEWQSSCVEPSEATIPAKP